MNYDKARQILAQYNLWRRDEHIPNSHQMPNPAELGEAIDTAVSALSALHSLHVEDVEDISGVCIKNHYRNNS